MGSGRLRHIHDLCVVELFGDPDPIEHMARQITELAM